MCEDCGLDDEQPKGPFHPADVAVSLTVFAREIFGAFANLFNCLRIDAQTFADTHRGRRHMRKTTEADIRSLLETPR